MAGTVRAKFRVNSKSEVEGGHRTVYMTAVYSADPNHENRAFADATPSGNFNMTIKEAGPHGFFEVGREYYLDFTPAPPAG